MANNAIGASLEIPQSVLDKLDMVDKKLQNIATTADNMSKSVIASFNSIGTQGVDSLLAKINQLQSGIGNIDMSKLLNEFNKIQSPIDNSALSAEQLANAVARVTQSFANPPKAELFDTNQVTIAENSLEAINEKIRTYKMLLQENRQFVVDETQQQNAQRYIDEINRLTIEYGKLNAQKKISESYDRAMGLSENTDTQRANKLAKLADVYEKMSLESGKYADQLEKIRQAQERINKIQLGQASLKTFDGAMGYANNATSIERRTQAIKYLTDARRKLSTTDVDYTNKLAQLNNKILELNKANAQAVAGSKELKKQHSSLIDTSSQLARKMALIFSVSQITGYINNMISVRGEMELQQRSLEAILQNKTKADAIYQQITDLAVRSPFTIQELTSYTKQLAAYRIETEKLYDTTKMLADISAGLGVDMQRLILAFGQVKAANYLRGQELRQFSEAGINILGELADYFGELNNRVYSTADVFDMVSKRMVKFSDVEQVLKRLTSEGGIFYNMQEIQAETLKGQLSNLRDTLDVMFNEIGKANDGVLKDSVAFVRFLVKNWEILADVLKFLVAPAFVTYAGYIVITTANKYKLIAANTIEITQMNALQRATIKTIASYKNLIAMMKANAGSFIWGGSVTAIATIGIGIYEWSKRVEANREKYDELNKSIYSNLDGINASMDAMLKQSSIIDSNNKLIASNTLNEQENKNAQEQVNKATNQRNILIKKFAEEYPDYYQQIKSQLETTDDIKAAQERLNKQLELTNTLMFAAKSQEGWFSDGFIKNLEESDDEFTKLRLSAGQVEAVLQKARNSIRELFQKGIVSKDIANEFESILTSEDETYDKILKIRRLLYAQTDRKRAFLFNALGDANASFDAYLRQLTKAKEASKDLANNSYEIATLFFTQEKIYTKEQFEALSDERKKAMLADAVSFLQNWKNASKEAKQIVIDEFAKFGLNIPISFTFETGNKEDDFLTNQINDYLQKNVGVVKLNSLGITFASGAGKEYLEQNIAMTKELRKELEQTTKATTQLNKDKTNAQRIKEIKDELKARDGLTKAFGLYNEEVVKNGTKWEDIDKSRWGLLKELRSQYEDLLKYYTQEEAAQKVYKNNKAEIVRLGLQVNEMTKYELNEYLKLLHTLKQTPDVLKEISKVETLIDIKIKEDSIKKAKDKIDNLFSGYEFGVELEANNIDPNMLKTILGGLGVDISEIDFEPKQITDVYREVEDEIKKLRDEDTIESNKLADEASKKLEDSKLKYAKDTSSKLMSLTKNFYQEQSVIADKAKNLSLAKKMFDIGAIDVQKYSTIVKEIVDKSNTELGKLKINKFKATNDYMKIMGDLTAYNVDELEQFAKKLNDAIATSGASLPIEDFKQLQNALEKINKQIYKVKQPFSDSNIAKIFEISELDKKISLEKEHQNELLKKQKEIKEQILEIQEKLKNAKDNKEAEYWSNELVNARQESANVSNNLMQSSSILSSMGSQMSNMTNGAGKTLAEIDTIVKAVYQSIKATIEMFNEIKELADSFGAETDRGGWKDASIIMDALGETNEKVMGSWESFKNGDFIGATVKAVGAVFSVVKGVNALFDNKYEKRIAREERAVEKLEKAYKKLGEAIHDAYSIDQLQESNEQAQANIKAQIASYERMIASEEAKKDTDKDRIKEWQNTIEELKEQAEELEKTQIEELGGIADNIRSTTREFVDAWYDAFSETGDGLSGLEDKFNDMFVNIIKEQATLKIADKFLKPLYDNIDKSLKDYKVTTDEANALKNQATVILPEVSKALEQIFGAFKSLPTKSGELSGLQKGIQGVTEETAQALEALLNSMRFFVADSNKQLQALYRAFTSLDENYNPILGELRVQTEQIRSINKLLNNVSKAGHSKGGYGLKVFLD